MRRKLGQHFLIDKKIITRILSTAGVSSQDNVLEIGPGKGALTFALARHTKQLIAVEYDPELVTGLEQKFRGQEHISIIQADARAIDYDDLLLKCKCRDLKVKVVANLPYYAAVPIVLSILRYAYLFSECTLMFQKEVAERITASPGNKSYSPFTLTVQYYSEPKWCFAIPAEAFRPRPKVASAVVKLCLFDHPRVHVINQEDFFHLIKCAFRSRRKTLKNSLVRNCPERFPVSLLNRAYECLHLPEHTRAEELSIEDYAQLSNFLTEKIDH